MEDGSFAAAASITERDTDDVVSDNERSGWLRDTAEAGGAGRCGGVGRANLLVGILPAATVASWWAGAWLGWSCLAVVGETAACFSVGSLCVCFALSDRCGDYHRVLRLRWPGAGHMAASVVLGVALGLVVGAGVAIFLSEEEAGESEDGGAGASPLRVLYFFVLSAAIIPASIGARVFLMEVVFRGYCYHVYYSRFGAVAAVTTISAFYSLALCAAPVATATEFVVALVITVLSHSTGTILTSSVAIFSYCCTVFTSRVMEVRFGQSGNLPLIAHVIVGLTGLLALSCSALFLHFHKQPGTSSPVNEAEMIEWTKRSAPTLSATRTKYTRSNRLDDNGQRDTATPQVPSGVQQRPLPGAQWLPICLLVFSWVIQNLTQSSDPDTHYIILDYSETQPAISSLCVLFFTGLAFLKILCGDRLSNYTKEAPSALTTVKFM
ncbi:hypothetical protein Pelo_2165 [Pelomyxa schiedti]|nr:hypothetical protein Pelo_2165 [Pelomyxa schiedti]